MEMLTGCGHPKECFVDIRTDAYGPPENICLWCQSLHAQKNRLNEEIDEKIRELTKVCVDMCLYGDIAEYDLSTLGLEDDSLDQEEWTRAHCAAAIAAFFNEPDKDVKRMEIK